MEKQTLFILLTTIIVFDLFLILGATSMTGYSVADQIESFFVGNAFSALGPIIVISLILAIGIFALYEVRLNNKNNRS